MGSRRRDADPGRRGLGRRRGMHAGRVRAGVAQLAARRRAGAPGCVADHGCPQPGARPAAPRRRRGVEAADRRRRPARHGGGGRRARRRRVPRRPVAADLHLLPPGARVRRAHRADAPLARRSDDGGDRTRVPRARADDGEAARPREAEDPQRRHPVPRAAARAAAAAYDRRARRPLPPLQRGLLGVGGRRPRAPEPLRRRDPPHPRTRRAAAGRARGGGAARAHALPVVAAARARRRRPASW